MELVGALWDFVVHLDAHLASFVSQHGAWVYALLFAIVFCETGLVVTPFLPGDSLLFVVGALAAAGGMDIVLVMALLVAAALSGDNVNYWIGRWAGPKVFRLEESRWLALGVASGWRLKSGVRLCLRKVPSRTTRCREPVNPARAARPQPANSPFDH